jgi:hypothetical protein
MKRIGSLLLAMVMLCSAGCQSFNKFNNTMTLVNYAKSDSPETLQQNFKEGFFSSNAFGEYEVLLKSDEPISQGGEKVMTQTIYATTLWKPIPGTTYAESSQINATIVYVVRIADKPDAEVVNQGGETTLRYEGTGFLSFQTDPNENEMTGTIERAVLKPMHKRENYRLGTFEMNGSFKRISN